MKHQIRHLILFASFVMSALLANAQSATPVSANILVGKDVTLTVTADGTSPFGYQWFKGGSLLSNGGRVSNATTNAIKITGIQLADAGDYTAKVSNSAGNAVSPAATLAIGTLPVFTTQPASQTLAVGASVTLSSLASATPGATYQWFKGGVAISGAKSANLTIASAALTDQGAYTVVATNIFGSTTSAVANLTVNALVPTINSITITVSP